MGEGCSVVVVRVIVVHAFATRVSFTGVGARAGPFTPNGVVNAVARADVVPIAGVHAVVGVHVGSFTTNGAVTAVARALATLIAGGHVGVGACVGAFTTSGVVIVVAVTMLPGRGHPLMRRV